GGGVGGVNGTFTISAGTFTGNTGVNGVGVYLNSNKKITVSGGTFGGTTAAAGNTATSGGGGIYLIVNGASSSITGGTYQYNTANVDGGGICVAASTQPLTISGVTVKNNTAVRYGGGLRLYRTNVTMSGNSVVSDNEARYGAGIQFESNGTTHTFTISSTTISNNRLYAASDAACQGGGIHGLNGTVNVNSGTTITGNGYKDGTLMTTSIPGGGIYTSASVTTINGATLEANYSTTSASYGGAVYTTGGSLTIKGNAQFKWNWGWRGSAISGNSPTTTIESATFYKNGYKGTNSTTIACTDGALYLTGKTLVIKKVTFEGNVATSASAGIVFSNASGTMTVGETTGANTDVVFKNNCATGSNAVGGAIDFAYGTLTINKGTFEGNSAVNGGAIYVTRNSKVIVNDGVFKNNGVVNTTAGVTRACTYGGAISAYYDSATNLYSNVTINGGTFTGNNATYGGAILAWSDVTVNNGTFQSNTATYGSFMYASMSGKAKGNITINNCTATGNTAAGNATNGGGAVYCETNSVITIKGGKIQNNTTTLATAPIEKSAGVVALGTLNMSGAPVISGNKVGTTAADLYSAYSINITAQITTGFNVSTVNKGVLTSGYNSVGKQTSATLFKTNLGSGYKVAYQGGEIIIVTSATDATKVLVTPTQSAALTYNGSRQAIVSGYDANTMKIDSVKLTRFTATDQSKLGTTVTTLSSTTAALGYTISGKNITVTEAGQYVVTISAKTSGSSWVKADGTTVTGAQTFTVTVNKRLIEYSYGTQWWTFGGVSYLQKAKDLYPKATDAGFSGILSSWTFTYAKYNTSTKVTEADTELLRFAGYHYVTSAPVYAGDAGYNNFIQTATRTISIAKAAVSNLVVTVTNANNIVYDGTAKKPSFTIAYKGSDTATTTMYTYNGSTATANNATLHGSLT
ncbi:MAG: hypothetical protein K2K04_00805, partial [Clostridia bacterium]|nr:hypothetical protein [Clostridia bacterium]